MVLVPSRDVDSKTKIIRSENISKNSSGVTTSRATSGDGKNDPNTSGQR